MELLRYINSFLTALADCISLQHEEADALIEESRDDFEIFLTNLIKLDKIAKLGLLKDNIGYRELKSLITEKI